MGEDGASKMCKILVCRLNSFLSKQVTKRESEKDTSADNYLIMIFEE